MANYEVKRKKIGAYAKTLVANTADKVTFVDEPPSIQVWSDRSADIYVTIDGTDPVVGGEGTYELPAGESVLRIAVPNRSPKAALEVRLTSPGTPKYSVSKVGD